MKNFNLLVSTSRYNEANVKAELWFTLLICGDNYPIISKLKYSGLISALTTINCRDVIKSIKELLEKDPNFFQYILKIVPIDFICETDLSVIDEIIKNHYRTFIKPDESFRIRLIRRKNELIERNKLITHIAQNIDNKVNLDKPDKIIRIEMLGNYCGIGFLTQNDIIKIHNPLSLEK